MWDVLRWHNDTLSIAWWAMIGFAILVIIAAGARAAKVAARLLGLSNALLCGLPSHRAAQAGARRQRDGRLGPGVRFPRWVSQNPSPNLLVGLIEELPRKCNQGRLFD